MSGAAKNKGKPWWLIVLEKLEYQKQTPGGARAYELLKKEQIFLTRKLHTQVQKRHILRASLRAPSPLGPKARSLLPHHTGPWLHGGRGISSSDTKHTSSWDNKQARFSVSNPAVTP